MSRPERHVDNLVPRGRDPFVQRRGSLARPLPHPLDKSNGGSGDVLTNTLTFAEVAGFVTTLPVSVHSARRLGCLRSLIAHEAEGRMGYEGERNNCFSKIQLLSKKYRDKTTLASETRFSRHCFGFQSGRF